MDSYEKAMAMGYYFDRHVDLEFFDSNGNKVYALKTPEVGVKPSITVKGELLEGFQGIATYISVQNMSYSVDVRNVAMVRCSMYYSCMRNPLSSVAQSLGRSPGQVFDFTVLCADQEKEPPNRAVRFQCVVAAQGREMADIPISISASKGASLLTGASVPESGTGSKDGAKVETTLVDYLEQLAKVRNQYVTLHYTGKNEIFQESLKIKSIEYPKDRKNMKIVVSPKVTSFKQALLDIGSMNPPDMSDPGYARIKASSFLNSIIVTTIQPNNWEERAEALGFKTDEQKLKFWDKYYGNDREVRYIDSKSVGAGKLGTMDNPIPLNFVKSAYRAENVVTVSVLYDPAMYPGAYVAIRTDAIMGKMGTNTKMLTRIIDGMDVTIFRITGAIEYVFSTTEASYMTFKGAAE